MSNVDRYRPAPREGYQPPSLPAKPPPTAMPERPSKSPIRRRDVPPAVPSPPSYSSRSSPPRPQSRRSAPSPAQSSPQRASQPRPQQWFFGLDEVASSPSVLDGLTIAEERLRRSKGVNFIIQAGILLNLPQTTLWVAAVFFHRFYMRVSMVEDKGGIHHYNIAATALFLANKTEENCRKTKDLIIAVAKIAQKNAKLIIDEQSKEYWRWRDSILAYEELMLEMLTFDLMITIPYHRLYEHLEQLEMIHHKPLRDAAWAFCNDACLTVLPLLMSANDISVSAIFFASSVTQEKISDVRSEAWWRFLDGNENNIVKAVSMMTEFYQENPLKKQDTRIPGSPTFNLESTRRRGENIGGDSSHGGTPIGTDRGTQSPRAGPSNMNGRADHANDVADGVKREGFSAKKDEAAADFNSSRMSIDLDSQTTRGDCDAALKIAANDLSAHEGTANGNGLRSPALLGAKRKSVDRDVDSEEREPKRPRTADEDEGEIKSS